MGADNTELAEAWQTIFTPRDRRPIEQWAHDNVWLSPPITKTGWFDCSDSRHFIGIFAALQDDRIREVNVLKPVRGGGSLIGDVFCPWTFAVDPGPYMDFFQTQQVAEDHSEDRITKIFDKCKPVATLYPADQHKQRNKEILFANGYTWYLRWPSIANMQSKGARYLRLEEVWMWEQGKLNEALGRIGDYLKMQTSKVLTISQGGPMDGVPMEEGDWFRHYHNGRIFEWEVQCLNPECGKYFDPVFSGQRADGSFYGITWDRHQLPNGDWDVTRCAKTVHFECPHCKFPMLDGAKTKGEWNRTGRWRSADNGREKSEKKVSFHWEAVIDFPWQELVELWLDACNAEKRGDLRPKLQFYQKRRAMFKDEESLLKGGLHFSRAAYEINSDWPEERGRALTADRQEEDLFWWTARQWGEGKTRKLGFGKCYGFAALEEIRKKFKVPPNCTFVDSGYMPKGDHGVYAACIEYGWIAVRGGPEYYYTHGFVGSDRKKHYVQKSYAPLTWADPDSGRTGEGRRKCPLIIFSKPQMNELVHNMISNGTWIEQANPEDPAGDAEYNAQMSARVKKTEYNAKTGESKVFWKETKNDHAMDCANSQGLFGVLRELVPDRASEKLTKSEQEKAA